MENMQPPAPYEGPDIGRRKPPGPEVLRIIPPKPGKLPGEDKPEINEKGDPTTRIGPGRPDGVGEDVDDEDIDEIIERIRRDHPDRDPDRKERKGPTIN